MSCGDVNNSLGRIPKYSHNEKACNSAADPLNIIIRGSRAVSLGRDLRQIQNVDTGYNWSSPSFWGIATARDQWVSIAGSCKVQDDQYTTGHFWDRFHIRIWDARIGVLAGAHHENLLTLGGNPLRPQPHKPDSFESGKDSVAEDLKGIGKVVILNGAWMDNYLRVPYCSGWAAVIN